MEPILTKEYIFPLADSRATLETVGGKGASLSQMLQAGLPVPDGFHITTAAYRQFVEQNELQPRILEILKGVDLTQPSTLESASQMIQDLFADAQVPVEAGDAIEHAYAELTGVETAVAIRSSATAEDLPELSFAGQQETFLNIHGVQAVLEAVKRCWASLWTARAIGYRMQHKIDQEAVSLAVVVQELVEAEAAGILFTANPISGQRDEVVINAAWGLGEAIVGGKVSPDTIIADKQTGNVKQVEVAEKTVMTVRTLDGTHELPVPADQRKKRVLSDSQTAALVKLALIIETYFGVPQDIEWCWAKGKFHIVQSRPITKLAPEPIKWILPNPKAQYMRASIVDLMPDPLSPLFITMAIPAIHHLGVIHVMKELTHSEPILPTNYILTINDYAYLCGTFSLREWWWMITKLIPLMFTSIRQGSKYWRNEALPRYKTVLALWKGHQVENMTAGDLWRGVQELQDAAMLHLATLMVSTMGASAGTEGLFTKVYEKMIRRGGDPAATTFLMGYDSIPIQAEKSLYDLAEWALTQPELAAYLLERSGLELAEHLKKPLSLIPPPLSPEFASRFSTHLERFGHIIYNLDYAQPLPLDDPGPMLDTIKMYLRGQGMNPHQRQKSAEEKRMQAAQSTSSRLKGLRGWAFRLTLGLAQNMSEVREDALASIGLSYPVLRQMLFELGDHFVEAGSIEQAEDIFWLRKSEIEESVKKIEQDQPLPNSAESVLQRRKDWEAKKNITPPIMLPPNKKYMGFDVTVFTGVSGEDQGKNTLKGIAASAGIVTAKARVVRGPEDFDQMQPGDVLVAGITTPAWTPLFAMASAVVTDVGGPLSHGSIVAREYGIPAVMGTAVATKRIQSGQVITVDGNSGLVILKNEE